MITVSGSRLRRRGRRGMSRKSLEECGRQRGEWSGAGAAGHRTGLGEFLSKSAALFIEWRRLRKTDSSSPVEARRHFWNRPCETLYGIAVLQCFNLLSRFESSFDLSDRLRSAIETWTMLPGNSIKIWRENSTEALYKNNYCGLYIVWAQ